MIGVKKAKGDELGSSKRRKEGRQGGRVYSRGGRGGRAGCDQ